MGVTVNHWLAEFESQMRSQVLWGCSSAGRAPALQAGGRRFETCHLHQVFYKHMRIL